MLAAVGAQRGVTAEVIVVDSGSSDQTVSIADAAGARVIRIEPEDFGHGRTRNLAADAATGDVLLFLAQDAVLLGEDALHRLVWTLEADSSLAAVSARHVPRSSAERYGAYVVFAHDRAGVRGSAAARRRGAVAVDTVCTAIRRTAWAEHRFADVAFAEDLDFGVRATAAGWTVATSRDVAVAHSHSRDAAYTLRRGVVERLAVAAMLRDDREAAAARHPPELLLAAVPALAAAVQGALAMVDRTRPLQEQLWAVGAALDARAADRNPQGELARIAAIAADAATRREGLDALRDEIASLLSWPVLHEFARAQRAVPPGDAKRFVAHLTAAAVGRALGDAYRRAGTAAPAKLVSAV